MTASLASVGSQAVLRPPLSETNGLGAHRPRPREGAALVEVEVRAQNLSASRPSADDSLALGSPIDVRRGSVRLGELRPAHLQAAAARVTTAARHDLDAVGTRAEKAIDGGALVPVLRARADIEGLRAFLETLHDAHPDASLRARAAEVEGDLPRFGWPSSKGLLETIVELVEAESERIGSDDRSGERESLDRLERSLRDAGFGLDEDGTTRLESLAIELAGLARRYRENLDEDARMLGLRLNDGASLARLPIDVIDCARRRAKERGQSGLWFSMNTRDATTLLRFCDDPSVRAEVTRRLLRRGLFGEENNLVVAQRMIGARHELAQLLGYARFSDYARRHHALQSPEDGLDGVRAFAATGSYPLRRIVLSQGAPGLDISAFGGTGLFAHIDAAHAPHADHAAQGMAGVRAAHLVAHVDAAHERQSEFERQAGLREEHVRAYFPLSGVMRSLVTIARDLFGVTFEVPKARVPTWHPDVHVFDARDHDGRTLARVYLDLHERSGKLEGARTRCAHVGRDASSDSPPRHVFLVHDLPGSASSPGLLGYEDVLGLVHEFGHLMHACLGGAGVMPLDPFLVARETLEFPARLFERWWREDAMLERFARHHVSGAPMPKDLRATLIARERDLEVARAAETVALADADLSLHTFYREDSDGDLGEYAASIKSRYVEGLTSSPRGWIASAGHPHLFSSPLGYAGTYDAYLLADALAQLVIDTMRDGGFFHPRSVQGLRPMFEALSRDGAVSSVVGFVETLRRDSTWVPRPKAHPGTPNPHLAPKT